MITALADTVGAPFTLVPPQMMYFGGGGGAGWGTLCGALNGAALATNLVVDRTNATAIISDLFGWYTKVQFPSDVSNDLGERRAFLVNRYDKRLLQTVAGSPLCHASVSTWCTAAFLKSNSSERAERCARLTGDVAARTVEVLNQFFDGQFRAGFVPVRKPKKLPAETERISYELEYGMDTLEIHKDAVQPGMRVVVADDLLATGGTALATVRLVEKLGGQVAAVTFVIELEGLNGRDRLAGYDVVSLLKY